MLTLPNPTSPYYPLQWDEPRPPRCQYVKSAGNNAAAATPVTIFDSSVNGTDPSGAAGVNLGAGNVERVTIAIVGTGDNGQIIDSDLKFYVDDDVTPSITLTMGHLLARYSIYDSAFVTTQRPFFTDEMSLTTCNNTGTSGHRRIFVPYGLPGSAAKKCVIRFTNNGASPCQIYTQVEYRQGTIPTWRGGPGTRRARLLQAATPAFGNVAQYTTADLVNVTNTRGELESVNFAVQMPNPGNGWLEGHVVGTIDGSAVFEYGGTEDFFGGYFYFSFGRLLNSSDSLGASWNGGWGASGGATTAWRFFGRKPADRFAFNSGVRMTWANGINGMGAAPGTASLSSSVLYYRDH